MDDKNRGLYGKFKVERMDGSSGPGGKHEHCMMYVLDLEHDPHAKAAIRAYADSCEKDYPMLARDLRDLLKPPVTCGCRSAAHETGCMFTGEPPKFGT